MLKIERNDKVEMQSKPSCGCNKKRFVRKKKEMPFSSKKRELKSNIENRARRLYVSKFLT